VGPDLTPRRAASLYAHVTLPPFQTLVDAHGRDVYRFLAATAGRAAAEDCAQETWLAALRAYPRLRDGSNLRAWLLMIAHRKAIDHARRARRVAVPAGDATDIEAAPVPAPTSPDEELWRRVRALPPKQRTALTLRYVADCPYREIATVMDTTEPAARRNVHEALRRLRTEMEDER
jgi:RNA polymerase sigma factor (sigma-70 family)